MCDLWNEFELKKPPQLTVTVASKDAPSGKPCDTLIL